ncbi:hypothetical protein L6164_025280 [Bauhinia variegata]|uniref:Uncharacterized protein n=1 Tax=Bauhinia variegata TaxID=167791 RepID=A0ACB9M1G1_BAUVA|nr:hypothetical protein L6164_025280 [Bauhinia variegata]
MSREDSPEPASWTLHAAKRDGREFRMAAGTHCCKRIPGRAELDSGTLIRSGSGKSARSASKPFLSFDCESFSGSPCAASPVFSSRRRLLSYFTDSRIRKESLMVMVLRFRTIFLAVQATNFQTVSSYAASRCCHFVSEFSRSALGNNLQQALNLTQSSVGIFWDLDNKPPKSFQPYDAAIKLKTAVSSFGVIRHMIAYADRHTFSHVPQAAKEQRKERKLLNHLENKGVIKPVEPYLCRVCGRKFYTNEKLVNHFKQIHEREHMKRLNQIESAKGSRRAKLVGKYSMKMEKYKNAARDILTPKVGYGLADELKRAGFWVQTVLDKPQAADIALKDHMVDMMDNRRVDCVVLVSDDSDFLGVLKEAKLRCLKIVVIGDTNDGVLKRTADAAFSWEEILMGKSKKEAVSVVEKLTDRDILRRLEWTYNPEVEKQKFNLDCMVYEATDDEDFEHVCNKVDDAYKHKQDSSAWWELDSDDNIVNELSGK